MAKKYQHGSYAELGKSVGRGADMVAGLPVYVGRLPVHLTGDYAGKSNVPILIKNLAEAITMVGYSDDWEAFDLCEAIGAHFDNATQNVGPIVVINALDPDTMRKSPNVTVQVPVIGGRGEIADALCILKTCAIVGKTYGTDYSVAWNTQRGCAVLQDLTGTMASPVEVTYAQVDPDALTDADIIGTANDEEGVRTGIQAVATVYQRTGTVPTMLCAPGWGHIPAVRTAMLGAAEAIDGHWYAQVLTDIPVTEASISAAKAWRLEKGYTDHAEVVCWPMARKGDKKYHISTLSVVTAMQTDAANSGIPYETPSNKPVDITGYYIADGQEVNFTSTQANVLNAAGIRTVAYFAGRWALWGAHTAAYQHGGGAEARDTYDSNLRMLYYILGWFQVAYGAEVDKPMSRNRVDAIINEVRAYLDGLRSMGALLSADVTFDEAGSTGDLIEGCFTFNSTATPTPPIRAVQLVLAYSEAGLSQF